MGQRYIYQGYDDQKFVMLLTDIRKYSTSRTYCYNTKLWILFQNPTQGARDKINTLSSQFIHVQEKPSFGLDLNSNSILQVRLLNQF